MIFLGIWIFSNAKFTLFVLYKQELSMWYVYIYKCYDYNYFMWDEKNQQ